MEKNRTGMGILVGILIGISIGLGFKSVPIGIITTFIFSVLFIFIFNKFHQNK